MYSFLKAFLVLMTIFASIFDIYHWHFDIMLHHHRFMDFYLFFGTVLEIFGLSFVRALVKDTNCLQL